MNTPCVPSKQRPPPPVVINKQSTREHKQAVRQHYRDALQQAIDPSLVFTANRYQRKIWRGILKRLRGEPSPVLPLFKKETIMPHLREWAEKRGLI